MTTSRIMIPARMESSRLPGKLLLAESGKMLIQHTYEAALQAAETLDLPNPVVCFDDYRLKCSDDYMRVPDVCASGTDRIAIAARCLSIDHDDLIINWQGDEPLICTRMIRALITTFFAFPSCDIATLATTATTVEDMENPDVVKVFVHKRDVAADFKRKLTADCYDKDFPRDWSRHIGIYAYRAGFLDWLTKQPIRGRERDRNLEQMRAIDNGCRIRCAKVDHPHYGIDTRADYDRFLEVIRDA